MNSKSLRRLATDHASLHTIGLPPNYIFPIQASNSHTSCCDDLSVLDVLLVGPEGTAYQEGIFSLHLTIPKGYPSSPPIATFKTKIWHPNVDEKGSVCVDTLKSSWETRLTLRDVLVTISCLLIQPNPASALNADAGMLIQNGEWAAFEKRAKVMCGVYAAIPDTLKKEVQEARHRGEERNQDAETLAKKGKGKGKVVREKDAVKVREVPEEEKKSGASQTQEAIQRPEKKPEEECMPKVASRPLDLGTDNISGSRAKSTAKTKASILEDVMDLDSSLATVVHHEDIAAVNFGPSSTPPPKTLPVATAVPPASSLPNPVTPPTKALLSSDNSDAAPGSSSDDGPEFHFSWLPPRRSPKGKSKSPERSPEALRREKHELRKLKAAGYSIARYNRGQFGPRKGLMRL